MSDTQTTSDEAVKAASQSSSPPALFPISLAIQDDTNSENTAVEDASTLTSHLPNTLTSLTNAAPKGTTYKLLLQSPTVVEILRIQNDLEGVSEPLDEGDREVIEWLVQELDGYWDTFAREILSALVRNMKCEVCGEYPRVNRHHYTSGLVEARLVEVCSMRPFDNMQSPKEYIEEVTEILRTVEKEYREVVFAKACIYSAGEED